MTIPPTLPDVLFINPVVDPDLLISGPAEMIDTWLRSLGWLPTGEMPADTTPPPTQTLNLLMRTIDGTTYVHLRTDSPVIAPVGADVVSPQLSAVILGVFAGSYIGIAPTIVSAV